MPVNSQPLASVTVHLPVVSSLKQASVTVHLPMVTSPKQICRCPQQNSLTARPTVMQQQQSVTCDLAELCSMPVSNQPVSPVTVHLEDMQVTTARQEGMQQHMVTCDLTGLCSTLVNGPPVVYRGAACKHAGDCCKAGEMQRQIVTCDLTGSCSMPVKGPPVSFNAVHLREAWVALKIRRVLSKARVAMRPSSGR